MKTRILTLILTVSLAVTACATATVRQEDLDAWVGVPVEALDTHSLFIAMKMYRSITPSGIEVRNYANGGAEIARCSNNSNFTECSSVRVICNNIFYIKDGKVMEYAPTGRCYTNQTVQPQSRYFQLYKK